jgi:hypothetical protein
MIVAKAMRNRSPLDGSGEWFGRLGWHEQNALKNSVSHIQHIRRQKGIRKINSHPKSQGFFPHRPETLQKRILQIHNYRRIIINLQKNHGRLCRVQKFCKNSNKIKALNFESGSERCYPSRSCMHSLGQEPLAVD